MTKRASRWKSTQAFGSITVLCLASVIHSASAQSTSEQPPTNTELTGWARYEILFERNIFSNKRQPIRRDDRANGRGDGTNINDSSQSGSDAERTAAPQDPNADFVLRGVAIHDGQAMAFIEDRNAGGIILIGEGHTIGNGKIIGVALDHIEFESAGQINAIPLGYNLAGALGQTNKLTSTNSGTNSSNASSSTDTPAEQATDSPAAPLTGEAAVIERMRRAREQQLRPQ